MLYELNRDVQSEAYYYNQLDIPDLPMEVITFLWPDNTIAEVEALFWQVYDRVEQMEEGWISYYDTEMIVWPDSYSLINPMAWPGFTNCWLYKVMYEWANDKTIKLKDRDKIKKTLFELSICKQSSWFN